MSRAFSGALSLMLAAVAAGCAGQATPTSPEPGCEEAARWIEQCVGLEVGSDGCDEETAAAALEMSCDELAEAEGKSDCGFWTPWDCWNFSSTGGSSSSSASGYAISVSVDECHSSFIDDCAGVSSLQCARVVLEDASGAVVAEGFSGLHGGLLFDGLEAGAEYTVRVLRRDGTVAEAIVGDYAPQVVPAVQVAAAEDDDGPTRVRFSLRSGEEELVRSCASVRVRLDVVEPDGTPVEAEEIEWDWIAAYEDLNGPATSRAFRGYGESASSFLIHDLLPGGHQILFHRVSIPAGEECSWYYVGGELRFGGHSAWYGDQCRLPNRNELLLENFAVDEVAPVAAQIAVSEADVGGEAATETIVLTDPVPGE